MNYDCFYLVLNVAKLTWHFLAKILMVLAHFWFAFTERILATQKLVAK